MHDKSKHAKCLTSQFADTLGTKSDYELYATINRAQRFIKQFIVHKNDKMYLSDRTRRADLCAACWKKGQRCLFYILTLKLRAQSTLQKKKNKKKNALHTFLSRVQIFKYYQSSRDSTAKWAFQPGQCKSTLLSAP